MICFTPSSFVTLLNVFPTKLHFPNEIADGASSVSQVSINDAHSSMVIFLTWQLLQEIVELSMRSNPPSSLLSLNTELLTAACDFSASQIPAKVQLYICELFTEIFCVLCVYSFGTTTIQITAINSNLVAIFKTQHSALAHIFLHRVNVPNC